MTIKQIAKKIFQDDSEAYLALLGLLLALVVMALATLAGCTPATSGPVGSVNEPQPAFPPQGQDLQFEVLTIKGSGVFGFLVMGVPLTVEVGATANLQGGSEPCAKVRVSTGLLSFDADFPKGCSTLPLVPPPALPLVPAPQPPAPAPAADANPT